MLANTNSRPPRCIGLDGVSQRPTDVKRFSSIAELPGRAGTPQKKAAPGYSQTPPGFSFAFG